LKPAAFRHYAPTELSEALELLAQYGDAAKPLAGGQSLVPALNFRLARFEVLIDLNRIAELAYIRRDGEFLRIGAMTRQRGVQTAELLRQHAPLLCEATRFVSHLPIRSRGTIGGSLSHADPAAEYPAVALALDGVLVLRNRKRVRRVAAADFFKGVFSTALEPDELLVELELPIARNDEGFAFDEVSRRQGDFAIAGVAASVALREKRIVKVSLAACGIGEAPVRLRAAEQMLLGGEPGEQLFSRAAAAAEKSISPQSDIHADAYYRRRLVASLVRSVATCAAQRAKRRDVDARA
jgi:CO/xanthine dehydrogenase FAD-binding subunit